MEGWRRKGGAEVIFYVSGAQTEKTKTYGGNMKNKNYRSYILGDFYLTAQSSGGPSCPLWRANHGPQAPHWAALFCVIIERNGRIQLFNGKRECAM